MPWRAAARAAGEAGERVTERTEAPRDRRAAATAEPWQPVVPQTKTVGGILFLKGLLRGLSKGLLKGLFVDGLL